jgi:PIN domain nuclease of toxin-antitoxin system
VRLLLDSHVVLWLTADVPERSSRTFDALVDEANETLVSAVSIWNWRSSA